MAKEDSERERKSGKFQTVKNLAYENRRKLKHLWERVDLLKQNILAAEIELKKKVPPPTTEIAELKKRLTSLEEDWELFIKSIESIIATPSAAEKLSKAEEEFAKYKRFFAPHSRVRRPKKRRRKRRPQPKEWKEDPSEELLVKKDREEWEKVLKREGMPATDPGAEKGLEPLGEDYVRRLYRLVELERERKQKKEGKKEEG